VQAFYTSAQHRAVVPCDSTAFLLFIMSVNRYNGFDAGPYVPSDPQHDVLKIIRRQRGF